MTPAIFDEIRKLISSEPYRDLAHSIITQAQMRLCTNLYEAEIAHCVNLCNASGWSPADVAKLVTSKDIALQQFCVAYIAAAETLDAGQEYNPDELPEHEEEAEEFYNGHSHVFLFEDAVYFLMLREKPASLVAFLRAMRVPHAARQAKGLLRLYQHH